MSVFTKKAIKETFIKLLDKKPLSEITVKLITSECGINRNTFYYHYEDIPSLIEEVVMEEFDSIINMNPTIDSIENALLTVLAFAQENKRAISHIYNSINRSIFENYLFKFADKISRQYMEKITEDKNITDSDKELLNTILRAIAIGMTLDYMNTGMRDEVTVDIHRICETASGSIENMLKNFENK